MCGDWSLKTLRTTGEIHVCPVWREREGRACHGKHIDSTHTVFEASGLLRGEFSIDRCLVPKKRLLRILDISGDKYRIVS